MAEYRCHKCQTSRCDMNDKKLSAPSHQIIKKSPKHPGGGGVKKNFGIFPLFGTFFSSMAPLSQVEQYSDKI